MKGAKSTRKFSAKSDAVEPRRLDLRKAVRGKHYLAAREGTEVAVIAPDPLDGSDNTARTGH